MAPRVGCIVEGHGDVLAVPLRVRRIAAAKQWLGSRMTAGRQYRETLDQPALTAEFDLVAAKAAPSFAKCLREVTTLVAKIQQRASG